MVIENKLDTPLQEEDEELISEKRLGPKEAERKIWMFQSTWNKF